MNRNIRFFSVCIKPVIAVDSSDYVILPKIKNINISQTGIAAEYKYIFRLFYPLNFKLFFLDSWQFICSEELPACFGKGWFKFHKRITFEPLVSDCHVDNLSKSFNVFHDCILSAWTFLIFLFVCSYKTFKFSWVR